MKSLSVGITGLSSSDNPGPGIGLARSLKEAADLDVRVIGLGYDAMETGLYLREFIDEAFLVPYPQAGSAALMERLLYLRNRCGLDVLIPSLDVELPLYQKLEPQLSEAGIATFLPTRDQYRLRGKDKLSEIAPAVGLELPETSMVTSVDDLVALLDKRRLPLMIKGAHYKALLAHTSQEAIAHYHAIVAEWGHPVLVQEVVSGDEMNVIGVGDGDGALIGAVSIKKMAVTSLGKVWTAVSVRHEPMLEAARRFVAVSRWRGPFELECIVGEGRSFLIEINPRFPAWVWFATALGTNLPANLVRRLVGAPIPASPVYPAGRLFVRHVAERVMAMDELQRLITRGER